MSKPALRRMEELFDQVLALPPDERPAFLDAACAGDADLRAAVEQLLAYDGGSQEKTSRFLASPIVRDACGSLNEEPTRVGPAEGEPTAAGRPSVPGYELLGELGRGGMGVVYRARQRSLGRVVALKMIRDSRLADDLTVQRFYQEARAAAALDHPGIVPIYEVGQSDGQHYYTMALVEGPSLAAAVRRDGLPAPEVAAALVAAVADAAEYAHRHGVVHRDLKPENILLEGKLGGAAGPARPRVTDFGLARHAGGEVRLTAPGGLMGTPCYMAPEQARGEHGAVGPRTDVHALGALLYFLLTGGPPFTGSGVMDVLHQVMQEAPPSPRRRNPQVPEGLEAICLKCLEKDPGHRYATAGAVADALRAWAGLTTPGATPTRPPAPGALRDPSTDATVRRPHDSRPPAPPAAGGESPLGPNVPSARSGWRRALVAVGASALLVAVGVIPWVRWPRPPGDQGGPPDGGEVPVKVKGHEPPYRDFDLKVEMTGGSADEAGVRLLNEGEEVTFRIEVARDAYVGIWNVAPDGTVMQLFPNELEPDHSFRAGQPRTVPRRDIALVAVPSGGAEQVWVVASTWRWELPEGRRQGPYLIFETAEEQRNWEQVMERGFEVRKREAMAVAEVVLTYRVSPRK
jgi:eukaryotic-like serine/threonine-protein kinase